MPKTRKSTAPRNILPAEIQLTVTRFKTVLTSEAAPCSRDTGFAMKLLRPNPGVSVKGDVIYVSYPGAVLRFTIDSAAGDKNNYYPVGITFLRRGDSKVGEAQRLGFLNFSPPQIDPAKRSLAVAYRAKGDEPGSRYKFSVVVQRGSDGSIGIIDPDIVHDNSA